MKLCFLSLCIHTTGMYAEREEEEEHRNIEADGEDYPWSISPPAKRSKAEGGEREQNHQDLHLGMQIQGA